MDQGSLKNVQMVYMPQLVATYFVTISFMDSFPSGHETEGRYKQANVKKSQ